MFRSGERTFRSGERTFSSGERTFATAKHKSNAIQKYNKNRVYPNIQTAFLMTLWQFNTPSYCRHSVGKTVAICLSPVPDYVLTASPLSAGR